MLSFVSATVSADLALQPMHTHHEHRCKRGNNASRILRRARLTPGPPGWDTKAMASPATRDATAADRLRHAAADAGCRRIGATPQSGFEAALAAEVTVAWIVEASAKRVARWWQDGEGRSPTRTELAAMSSAAVRPNGWAPGHRLHMEGMRWCLFGRGEGHPDSLAHYVCFGLAWEMCSRATFCDCRSIALREWLGLSPEVAADGRASVEGARRFVRTTLAYHRMRAMWTAGGCKRRGVGSHG